MTELPQRPTLRNRASKRLFGGPAGRVFRGMVTLATGSMIGRGIAIAAMPVLTRLYTPEDFGALAVFTAFVAILAPVVTLRFVLALPLPRHDGLAMNVLALCLGLSLGMTVVLGIGLWLFGDALFAAFSMQVIVPLWWLVLVGLCAAGLYETLSFWATRRKHYKLIAQTNVMQAASAAVVKIGLGVIALGPLGLLLGYVASRGGGIGRMLGQYLHDLWALRRHVSAKRVGMVARRYSNLAIYRLPSGVLHEASAKAPMLIAAYYFSSGETGQLAVAFALIAVPVSLIGTTMAKAFLSEAAEIERRRGDILKITRSVALKAASIGLIATLVLATLAPPIMPIILGEGWELVGVYCAILAIPITFQFLCSISDKVLLVKRREALSLMFSVSRAVIMILSLIVAASAGLELYGVILVYVIALSAQRLFQFFTTLLVI